MARTQSAPKAADPAPDAAPSKSVPKICATCWAWVPFPNAPTFGQCKASHSGMMGMLTTPDLASCSLWPAPKFDPEAKKLA